MTYGVVIGERGDPQRWKRERRWIRRGPGTPFRKLQTLGHLARRDRRAVFEFLTAPYPVPRRQRVALLRSFVQITNAVRGYHTLTEILMVADRIFRLGGRDGLTLVEAGAAAGGSTAKLSLVARAVGAELHVFDTFRGIPDNREQLALLDGTPIRFVKGAFRGRQGAVRRRVAELGAVEVCEFHKGLFEQTLPAFDGVVDVALLDVDLLASTRTCVRELYPRLRAGGSLLSQDGHLRETHALFADPAFWRDKVGRPAPRIDGLHRKKLIEIHAPA